LLVVFVEQELVLKVQISDITAAGFETRFELSREDLDSVLEDPRGEIIGAGKGLTVEARLDRMDDTIFVKGQIAAEVGFKCVRCSSAREMGLEIALSAVLMPRPGAEGHPFEEDEEGIELSAEDLDVTFYDGTEIDLDDIVREAIYLEMPDYPSCGVEPKEACPDWQANIGEQATKMEENSTDLRWEALKAIKARMADREKN